jgi:hypothetical protein
LAPVAPNSPSIFSTVPITLHGAGLNLALRLEEAPIGALETLRRERGNVNERDQVYPEHAGRIGDVKLRDFECTHIRPVRLIQQQGEFAKHDQQPTGRQACAEHGLAGRAETSLLKRPRLGEDHCETFQPRPNWTFSAERLSGSLCN